MHQKCKVVSLNLAHPVYIEGILSDHNNTKTICLRYLASDKRHNHFRANTFNTCNFSVEYN